MSAKPAFDPLAVTRLIRAAAKIAVIRFPDDAPDDAYLADRITAGAVRELRATVQAVLSSEVKP